MSNKMLIYLLKVSFNYLIYGIIYNCGVRYMFKHKPELLSPAGSIDAFYAGISNGADAIYFGLNSFSARAYAQNFSIEECKLITSFAHLRNVKVFCTMNTITYDCELDDAYKTIDTLALIGVDAIIVQDLALFHYITHNYSSIEAHVSTQVGIDDLEGIKICKELGAKRVVLAREVNIETIKKIKQQIDTEIETFVHGALCVSYSGNCFMSGLIGLRSGNRGRCVGCCRKMYTLIDRTNNIIYPKSYLYSMKDLNTTSNIEQLKIVDSLKIEGRMKEPSYVASITKYYRDLLDGKDVDEEILYKNFQRTFTKGYIFGEDPKDITNTIKPNNFGYLVGNVKNISKDKVTIKLNKEVSQYDQIRIGNYNEEVSIPLVKMYDSNNKLINSSNSTITIDIKEKVKIGDPVYKTKDVKYLEEIKKTYKQEFKRLPLKFKVKAIVNKPVELFVTYEDTTISISGMIVEKAIKASVTKDNFKEQLSKLNDTPYRVESIDFDIDDSIFIPLKEINNLRRNAIKKINEERLKFKVIKLKDTKISVPDYTPNKPKIVVEVRNEEQYNASIEEGIKEIYFKNRVPRNNAIYNDYSDTVLVGGLGGVEHYRNKNYLVSDYSLNVVNHRSVAILHSLGVNRVTLSYEVSKDNINSIINEYYNEYNTYPNLELIVYGRLRLMVSKYCPLKNLGMCGQCKVNKYLIDDGFEKFPIVFNDDCTTEVLNSKTLNLIDDLNNLKHISKFRLSFTTESSDEVKKIIKQFKEKIEGKELPPLFDKQNNTRGHFNREII